MKKHLNTNLVYYLFSATVISAIILLIASQSIFPYRVDIDDVKTVSDKENYFYIDLDHDGYSELARTKIYSDQYYKSEISFYTYNNSIIEQFNFPGTLFWAQSNAYFDFNNDNYDECVVFTAHRDSLFLNILDIRNKNYFLRHQFIFQMPNSKSLPKIAEIKFMDLHNDGSKYLLFIYNEGDKPKKRGLYAYDVHQKKLVQSFENNSAKTHYTFFDFDSDGEEEILLIGGASGNIYPKDAPYSDWTNWIFVLDHNFNLKFSPLSLGIYPSRTEPVQFIQNGKAKLLLVYQSYSESQLENPNRIYLLGEHAKLREIACPPFGTHLKIIPYRKFPNDHFLASYHSGTLVHFDENFDIQNRKETDQAGLTLIELRDLDQDGKEELVTSSSNGYHIFDSDLNLLVEINTTGVLTFKQNGLKNPVSFGISSKNNFYTYSNHKNNLYKFWPVFALFTFLIILFLNWGLHRLLIFLNIVRNYLLYSFKNSKSKMILIRPDGKIYYISRSAQIYLNLKEVVSAKNFFEIINAESEFIDLVRNSIGKKVSAEKEILLNQQQLKRHASVAITPFGSRLKNIHAYFIEIRDLTETIYSERQQIWSRTVQKMAHDIKTPLAAVKLNLETLRLRIMDNFPEAETTADDFNLISEELERIRELTSDFLKFTNLEKPNFQSVSLAKIIMDTKEYFKSYLNHRIHLEIIFSEKIENIRADEHQMEMLFRTLIENSIDAVSGSGKILIETTLEDSLIHPVKKQLMILIADSGPGVKSEQRSKIFEPNFTTKNSGTGMGLAIAEKIVTDHEGEIKLVERKGFGAVFQIILPYK